MKERRAAYGRVPTVPVPIPVLAAAGLLAAFAAGRASEKMCRMRGGFRQGTAGCGPRLGVGSPERGADTAA